MTDLLKNMMARRIRSDVQSMHAYAVQDSAGLIKLDAMENPHRLSPALQAELGARLGKVAINRYPAQSVEALRQALIAYADIPAGYDLMLGNGSDELISLLAMACDIPNANPPATILAPAPGFVMYSVSAQLQSMPFVGVALDADFELDVPAMQAAIAQHQPALTYLAYPNNPTGNLWKVGDMEAVITACAAVDGIVVIDEAYQPFAGTSFIDKLAQFPNVLLLRTMSKFGLAGVRVGYLIGPAALIAEINKARPPYNISVLNAECALFALEHAEVFAEQAAQICAQRDWLQAEFAKLPQVRAYPSYGNMILLRILDNPHGITAASVFAKMKAAGVLVKNVSSLHPSLANCLRPNVGLEAENRSMIDALKSALTP